MVNIMLYFSMLHYETMNCEIFEKIRKNYTRESLTHMLHICDSYTLGFGKVTPFVAI